MHSRSWAVVLVAGLVSVSGDPMAAHADRAVELDAPDLHASLDRRGAHLALPGHAATLAVDAIGREGAPHVVDEGAVTCADDEVRIARGEHAYEWWRSLSTGLEHGVTLGERPAGEGALEVRVAVDGLTPHLSGDAIELRDGARAVASYAQLTAIDATGARLPAHLGVEAGHIVLSVDDAAARYPLVIDPLLIALEATFEDAAPVVDDRYGEVVALAHDGSRALIGVPRDDPPGLTNSGTVRVMVRTGTTWAEEAVLLPADARNGDLFGSAVALSADGTRALVGAPADNTPTTETGSARVFVRTGSTWAEEATLTGALGPDALAGTTVALSADGSVAVVGAPGYSSGSTTQSGMARVFVRTGATWTEQVTLTASDAATNDAFGSALALSADGARLLVGVPVDDTSRGGTDSGSVHVFSRSGATWSEEAVLFSPSSMTFDNLGERIAVSADGNVALVTLSTFGNGIVPFTRAADGRWSSGAVLPGSIASLAITEDGRRAVFGVTSGTVTMLVRSGSTWTTDGMVTTTVSPGAEYGTAVALSGDGSRVIVGAHLDSVGGVGAGRAFVFTLAGSTGMPCGADDGCSSGFCTDGVCCTSRCAGGTSDCQACSAALTGGADGTCGLLAPAVAPTFTCRPATDACDAPEVCTSTSATCPTDGLRAAGTECRGAVSACDVAEQCTGASPSCPIDVFALATVECRPVDPGRGCDAAELCTGTSNSCPPDAPAAISTVCRAEAGPCDSAEVCDGVSFTCPGDAFEPMGNVCGTGMGDCALPATCTGSSPMCPSTGVRPMGTMCRPASGPCDVADVCDGASQNCVDAFAPDTTLCGTAPSGPCDAADHCAGTSADCVAVFLAGTECRASAGSCDPPELCTGGAADCPPDVPSPAGTVCRASTAACDVAESCDGASASCPADENTCADPDGGGIDAGGTDGGGLPDAATVDAGAPVPVAGCACGVGRPRSAGLGWLGLVVAALLARRR